MWKIFIILQRVRRSKSFCLLDRWWENKSCRTTMKKNVNTLRCRHWDKAQQLASSRLSVFLSHRLKECPTPPVTNLRRRAAWGTGGAKLHRSTVLDRPVLWERTNSQSIWKNQSFQQRSYYLIIVIISTISLIYCYLDAARVS